MRWPWQRAQPDTVPAVQRSVGGPPPESRAGWAFLPPLQRTVGPPVLTSAPLDFVADLPTRARPLLTGPMSHVVSPDAPSGVLDGDGDRLATPTSRSSDVDLTLVPPLREHPAARSVAVQRRAGRSLVHLDGPPSGVPPVRAVPVEPSSGLLAEPAQPGAPVLPAVLPAVDGPAVQRSRTTWPPPATATATDGSYSDGSATFVPLPTPTRSSPPRPAAPSSGGTQPALQRRVGLGAPLPSGETVPRDAPRPARPSPSDRPSSADAALDPPSAPPPPDRAVLQRTVEPGHDVAAPSPGPAPSSSPPAEAPPHAAADGTPGGQAAQHDAPSGSTTPPAPAPVVVARTLADRAPGRGAARDAAAPAPGAATPSTARTPSVDVEGPRPSVAVAPVPVVAQRTPDTSVLAAAPVPPTGAAPGRDPAVAPVAPVQGAHSPRAAVAGPDPLTVTVQSPPTADPTPAPPAVQRQRTAARVPDPPARLAQTRGIPAPDATPVQRLPSAPTTDATADPSPVRRTRHAPGPGPVAAPLLSSSADPTLPAPTGPTLGVPPAAPAPAATAAVQLAPLLSVSRSTMHAAPTRPPRTLGDPAPLGPSPAGPRAAQDLVPPGTRAADAVASRAPAVQRLAAPPAALALVHRAPPAPPAGPEATPPTVQATVTPPTVQPEAAPAPPPTTTPATAAVGAAAGAAGAAPPFAGASAADLDDLARRLTAPLLRRVRGQLLVDRERRGIRADL